MKWSLWCGAGALLLAGASTTNSARAQSLTGVWQGVEAETSKPEAHWPAVLRLQKSGTNNLMGVLYQEVGGQPEVSATFQMHGVQLGKELRLEHGRKLNETGRTMLSYWCDGYINFTYDPVLEKLTGHATYRPVGDCSVGTLTFYRIKRKSAATVQAGIETNLRVSGRNVLWYADAGLKKPVAAGNIYRTKLRKTTTFYLKQGYYPTSQSAVVPITIKVTGKAPKAIPAPRPAPVAPVAPPVATVPDTTRPAPVPAAPPLVAAQPVVLPTVLFRVGKAELLPEASPALDRLATELQARPNVRVRITGHTDRVGEPDKNQLLSEQRATTVKGYLVQAGIAADRLSTVGYGDSRPLYTSPDARNRRVEVEEVK